MIKYPRGHKAKPNDLGGCTECGEDVQFVVQLPGVDIWADQGYWRHARRVTPTTERARRFCSACGKPGEWYTFDRSGRCNDCAP